MKKVLTITVLFMFAVALTAVAAKDVQAFDIAFDGFCDGLTIDIGQDLHAFGSYNGCRSSAVSGNVNYALKPSVALAMTISPNETTEVQVGWTYIVNFDAGRTWCLYMSGAQFQCGTWSLGLPVNAESSATLATGE